MAVTEDVYTNGWRGNKFFNAGRTTYGYTFELGGEEKGGPLFTTQHPFLWINPFLYQDNYADYWEFCTNHALINRHYSSERRSERVSIRRIQLGIECLLRTGAFRIQRPCPRREPRRRYDLHHRSYGNNSRHSVLCPASHSLAL